MFLWRLLGLVVVMILASVALAIGTAPLLGGEMLGYASNQNRLWSVRLYDIRSRLDIAMPAGNFYPSTFDWSPDCNRIVFIHSTGRGGSVQMADLRTSKVTPLLDTLPQEGYSLPRWSPDSAQILLVHYVTGGNNDIVLLDVATSETRVLVEDVRGGVFPSWSPDGERVLYVGFENRQFDLFEYVLADDSIQRLTSDNDREISPAYAPDGKHIAFAKEIGGRSNIYVLNVTSGEIQRATPDFNDAISPTWSPDGEQIAYARGYNPFGDYNVFVLDLATQTEQRVTARDGWNLYPVWARCR